MVKMVFLNQDLITEDDFNTCYVTDCKPAAWQDNAPLEVSYHDHTLFHNIKGKLAGRALNYKVCVALLRILSAMHDDALCYRRVLLDEPPERTLYIDLKPNYPFVTLVDKTRVDGEHIETRSKCGGWIPVSRTPSSIMLTSQNLVTGAGDEGGEGGVGGEVAVVVAGEVVVDAVDYGP
jgi:hypothetical protein